MSTNHIVGEEVNVYERVKDRDIDVGDTIEVISNNQQGYLKYKVVNYLGKKELKLIDSYDNWLSGGRRRTRKRKSRKSRKSRKNNKSKRKTHKRRSHKRKM